MVQKEYPPLVLSSPRKPPRPQAGKSGAERGDRLHKFEFHWWPSRGSNCSHPAIILFPILRPAAYPVAVMVSRPAGPSPLRSTPTKTGFVSLKKVFSSYSPASNTRHNMVTNPLSSLIPLPFHHSQKPQARYLPGKVPLAKFSN